MTLRCRALVAVVLFFSSAGLVSAQVATGTPPFGSFAGSPDIVDLANLNAHWTIPVMNKPGRGTNFTYDLSYDTSVWYPVGSSGSQSWHVVQNWGWRGETEVATGYVSYGQGTCSYLLGGQPHTENTYSNFVYHDPFGVAHAFSTPTIGLCPTYRSSATATAADGSGYQLSAQEFAGFPYLSASITSTHGTVLNAPLQSGSGSGNYTDRNGNEISVDGSGHFYDTLSSTTPALTVAGQGTPSSPLTFTYTAPSGSSVQYKVSYVAYTVATNFAVSGISEYGATAINLVDKVTLPDGTFYQFDYEQTPSTPTSGACTPRSGTYQSYCVTGRIAKVTLPTGGSISYSYTGGAGTNNSGIFSDGSAATLSRQTPDGTWTYAQVKNSGAASTTTLTDPQGNQTVIQFQGIYETQREAYQGSAGGTLLQTINTCYNGASSPCTGTAISLPIAQRNIITSVPSVGSATLESERAETYSLAGVPTEIDEYGFGSGAPPSTPLQKTIVSYDPNLGDITSFPQTVSVENGSGTFLSQTNYNYDQTTPVAAPSGTPQLGSVSMPRGNLTSIQRCMDPYYCTSYKQTTMTYDTAGQPQTITDPLNNQTNFSYSDNFFTDSNSNPPTPYSSSVPTDAFVTTVTLPASGTMKYGYYYYSGQAAVSTDQNGNNSYSHFYDSLSRLTSTFGPTVSYPGGSGMPWALNVYASSDTQVDSYTGIADTSYSASCSNCRHDQVLLDGLGRNVHGYLKSDPEGQTVVDTAYDSDGRVQSASHPYRSTSDGTYGLETPTYDALGRTTKLTHADGKYSQTLYGAAIGSSGLATQACSASTYGVGYPTLFIDESGRKRQVWNDALGRTIEGDEPDSNGNLTSNTCYLYDALGNLLQIVHGSQNRTYVYDGLSRVSSVTIPELANSLGSNCSVTYTYDNDSNLKTRVAPAPNQTSCTTTVTTTYSYDALNRATQVSYNDGTTPTVQYGYDGNSLSGCTTTPPSLTDPDPKGRRTSMCDGSGATSWAYDAVGRITTESRIISGVNKTISYAYNLDSTIASVTYPSGKTITYTVSNAERLTAASDNSSGTQFVDVASYAPPGELQGLIAGQVSGGFAGVTESHAYDKRLEYTSSQASSSTGTALNLSLNYNLTGGDNGTVTNITNNVDNGRTQTLGYDPLNRVSSAVTQATSGIDCWGQSFSPDSLANLNTIDVTQCSAGALSVTVDGNNHINVASYDAAGNMTQDGTGYNYTFDAENRLTLASGMSGGPYCYVYDGNGLRVAKKSNASSCSSGTVTKIYWRSISGDALAETDGTGSTTNSNYNEYVFFAGRRVGSRNGSGDIFYWFADQLGTTRSITTGNGPSQTSGQLCYDADFTPYGQEVDHTEHLQTTACPPNYRFTGYEYDPETGLSYAFARYYSPRLGRFLSTDPIGGAIGDLQSHNAYAYVENNPPNLVDPSGAQLKGPNGTPGGGISSDPFDPMGDGSVWSDAINGEIPTYEWTGLYAQGIYTLNGVPVLLSDLFTVSYNFNPDMAFNIPIYALVGFWGQGRAGTGGGTGGGGGGKATNGSIEPLSRAKCASMIANDKYSAAAQTSGNLPDNPVVQALLGNSISGLYDLWNSPSIGDVLKNLAIGGVNPGLPGPAWSGGAAGVATDQIIKGVMTNIATEGGPAAAESVSSFVGLAKLGYDGGSFLYAYYFDCH